MKSAALKPHHARLSLICIIRVDVFEIRLVTKTDIGNQNIISNVIMQLILQGHDVFLIDFVLLIYNLNSLLEKSKSVISV